MIRRISPSLPTRVNSPRAGFSGKEVILATVIVLTFTMGMYSLSERSFARLYHFVSTLVGSPYS